MTVGAAQAFAIIPGVSRSGSTITAGLFRSMKRDTAARFSFYLSAPIIGGARALGSFANSELRERVGVGQEDPVRHP